MERLHDLFDAVPLAALFVTVALGYLAGKLRIKGFVLGGIAGTLLVGVVIGQLDVDIDGGIKSIFFALFIYAVGYQGGPQFFQSLNRKSLNQLISAFLMCFVGLLCVLAAASAFDLDRGTAAGLAAGGLTQSAIIGTAGSAISKLDVSPEAIRQMQTNVAVGYAVCYIFGSLGPILMISWFLPMVMRWDVRREAVLLAQRMAGGQVEPGPGQFDAARRIATRFYRLETGGGAAGRTVSEIEAELTDAAIESVLRDRAPLEPTPTLALAAGDTLALLGRIASLDRAPRLLGPEVEPPTGCQLIEENREIVLTQPALRNRTVDQIHDQFDQTARHGVFLTGVRRMGHELPLLGGLELHRGDELQLTGRPKDLDRVQDGIGYAIPVAAVTDFIFFGIGMTLGILLGMIQFSLDGVPVTIGSGGGCLLSGLLFGWLRSTHPRYAALPTGASNFLRDFGLAVFVGVVGISAGPEALTSIREHGVTLFLLGAGVTLVPQIVVFFLSYFVLGIRNPIEALACVAGGRSANPGFAALLEKAGNATPVVSFTVTYAIANVFLTLWGPIIVGLVTKNAGT
jgi:aspartate-alanine antiporter